MKQIITKITLTILSSSLIIGCSSLSSNAPSQNSALNNISNSNGKAKDGMMQGMMESWFDNDWTPTISQDKEIQEKYMQVDKDPQAQTTQVEPKAIKQTYIRKDGATKVVYKDGSEKIHYIEKDDKPFTLQEYVDKASAYRRAHPNDYEKSNVKKLESMPVIGN